MLRMHCRQKDLSLPPKIKYRQQNPKNGKLENQVILARQLKLQMMVVFLLHIHHRPLLIIWQLDKFSSSYYISNIINIINKHTLKGIPYASFPRLCSVHHNIYIWNRDRQLSECLHLQASAA